MSFIGVQSQNNLQAINQNPYDDAYHAESLSNSSFSSSSSQVIEIQRTWNFDYGVFQQRRLSCILHEMEQSFVEQAYLGTNENQKIPKIVSHINFPFLKILNLQTNHIKNIEVLQYLKVPELKQLNLKNNHITNLRVLRKLKWDKLQTLILQKNCIVDSHPTVYGSFGSLQKLSLQAERLLFRQKSDEKICETVQNLAKLNSQKLRLINCSSKKRIINPLILNQIKLKFTKTNQEQQNQNHENFLIIHQKKYQ